jgi:hypothetical protein
VEAALAALDAAILAEREATSAELAAVAELKAAPGFDVAQARKADRDGKPLPVPTSEKRRVELDRAKMTASLRREQAAEAFAAAERVAREHRTEWVEALGVALDAACAAAVEAVDTARATAAVQATLAAAYGALRVAPLSGQALPERAPLVDVEGLDELAASLAGLTRAAIDGRVDGMSTEPSPDRSGFAVPDPWQNGALVDADERVGA